MVVLMTCGVNKEAGKAVATGTWCLLYKILREVAFLTVNLAVN